MEGMSRQTLQLSVNHLSQLSCNPPETDVNTKCEQLPSDLRKFYEGNSLYQDVLRQTHTLTNTHGNSSSKFQPAQGLWASTEEYKVRYSELENKRKPVVFHVVEVWKLS